MKTLASTLSSFFRSQISAAKISAIYVKRMDISLIEERDVAIASSRMHHTSLLIARMMQEEYKLKKLQFEIALDKIMKTLPSNIKKDEVGRVADEINAKLIMLLPYPVKDDVLDQIRTMVMEID